MKLVLALVLRLCFGDSSVLLQLSQTAKSKEAEEFITCPSGHEDYHFDDWPAGKIEVGSKFDFITVKAKTGCDGSGCEDAGPAIFDPDEEEESTETGFLTQDYNLLVFGTASEGAVTACAPAKKMNKIVLTFDTPRTLLGFEMWDLDKTEQANEKKQSVLKWVTATKKSGSVKVPFTASGEGTGLVEVVEKTHPPYEVKKVVIRFAGPGALKRLRFCKDSGEVEETPTTTCDYGHVDYDFSEWAAGSIAVGSSPAPGFTITKAKGGGDESQCTGPAIYNADVGVEDASLTSCNCNLLVYEAKVEGQPVTPCTPSGTKCGWRRAKIDLEFDRPATITGFTMWDLDKDDQTKPRKYKFKYWRDDGKAHKIRVNHGDAGQAKHVSLTREYTEPVDVKKVRIFFSGPGGLKSIRFCREEAMAVGDPHMKGFETTKYKPTHMLMKQGTFNAWSLTGLPTSFKSSDGVKHGEVSWQLFLHYTGHRWTTQGFLLLDKSFGAERALELLPDTCVLHGRAGTEMWSPVEELKVQDGSDEATGFAVHHHRKTEMDKKGRSVFVTSIFLSMKTLHGMVQVAEIHVGCKPGHFINTKVKMLRAGDAGFVSGQLSAHLSKGHFKDDPNEVEGSWTQLGGSEAAEEFLRRGDKEPQFTGPGECGEEEEITARQICVKHLGDGDPGLDDCVFDVCNAKLGEAAAELQAAT